MSDIPSREDPIDRASDESGPAPLADGMSEAEIDDLLANPALTIDEKRAQLELHAGRMSDRAEGDRGSAFEPLEMRIQDALAMLADGGHVYGRGTASADEDAERPGPA